MRFDHERATDHATGWIGDGQPICIQPRPERPRTVNQLLASPSNARRPSPDASRHMHGGKGTAHDSITCHLACRDFIAGSRLEYGSSGAGMHRRAFSLRRKRTSSRSSPRASKCRAGLASDPGKVTWGKGRHRHVSGQQADSLSTCPWQRGLALFRPWWSLPYHLRCAATQADLPADQGPDTISPP